MHRAALNDQSQAQYGEARHEPDDGLEPPRLRTGTNRTRPGRRRDSTCARRTGGAMQESTPPAAHDSRLVASAHPDVCVAHIVTSLLGDITAGTGSASGRAVHEHPGPGPCGSPRPASRLAGIATGRYRDWPVSTAGGKAVRALMPSTERPQPGVALRVGSPQCARRRVRAPGRFRPGSSPTPRRQRRYQATVDPVGADAGRD